MVIAHGSDGVDTREAAWADPLGALGLATFVVGSFTPRNVRETATDQARLPTAANVRCCSCWGGRDDYTPPEACRGYAEWFRAAGAETTVLTYPDSYHDFDAYRARRFERALVTGRACDMAVDLDRFTVTRRGTGEDITATAGRYRRDCLARGATMGGDAEARRRAPEDVATFLRRVLRPETH